MPVATNTNEFLESAANDRGGVSATTPGKGKRIVVIGSANTDMVVRSGRIPVPGETVTGGVFMLNPGGKGANQAVACARLGGDTMFAAKVGDDTFGRETAERLAADGIDARLVTDQDAASGVALILVDAQGRNCISVAPGANATLTPSDLEPLRGDIEGAAMLLMQLETPVETVVWAAETAHAAGVKVMLNPAPATELPESLYRCLDWITPNETEAKLLTGVDVSDAASAKDAAAVLHARGVKGVVVTLGAQGAFWSEGGFCGSVPACPVKVVDTVAAGDTFNGAFAVALTEGKSVVEAVCFAVKASAISVTRNGAQSSVPRREEVDAGRMAQDLV